MLGHWDDVAPQRIEREHLRGTRWRLGPAAGATRLGLSRYAMGPGERAMPLHVHGDEDELFVILAGSGHSVEGDASFAVAAGDAVLYPAGGTPHTMLAGEEGLDVLAFASGSDSHLTYLPRARAMWAGPRWIPPDGPSPLRLEDAAGPLTAPPAAGRPSTIVRIADVEPQERRLGDVVRTTRWVARALGAARIGLSEIRVEPGRLSNVPHCHSTEEELFVVTEGDGALELLHPDGTAESHPVHVGHVIARPAATGVSHAFGAGDRGLTLLACSTVDPSDLVLQPRSGKVLIPGLKVAFRIQQAGFWDGEG